MEDFNTLVQPVERTEKIALIDADFIKYLVSYDLIEEGNQNLKENLREDCLIRLTEQRVKDVLDSFFCKGYIFCFSGKSSSTFRSSIAFEKRYKANRKGDLSYEFELEDKAYVMKYIMNHYPSLLFSDLEADDIISMLQCKDTFIYSKDKDLMQIPGAHFDMKEQEFIEVSNEKGNELFFKQMITGDAVDNIAGIKGYGDAKAKKLFNPTHTTAQRFAIVIKEYIAKYGLMAGIDTFCEMWMLLRLRTKRGTYLQEKYKEAFDLLNIIKNTTF